MAGSGCPLATGFPAYGAASASTPAGTELLLNNFFFPMHDLDAIPRNRVHVHLNWTNISRHNASKVIVFFFSLHEDNID